MEPITDTEAMNKIAVAIEIMADEQDFRRAVADAVAQSGRGPFAVIADVEVGA